MRLTKFGHACVRLEHDGHVVVVDPGGFTDREAVAGATALLVTHEHFDHYDLENLRAADAPVFTVAAVADQISEADPALAERVTVVAGGDGFDVGIAVVAVGDRHATVHPDLPGHQNSGFLLTAGETTVYHPGDAFTPPGRDVDVLCLPVSAPWAKVSEVLDFARAVGAARSLAVHDLIYSEFGLGIVDNLVPRFLDGIGSYVRLQPGQDL